VAELEAVKAINFCIFLAFLLVCRMPWYGPLAAGLPPERWAALTASIGRRSTERVRASVAAGRGQ
jgi:hypothetical protein